MQSEKITAAEAALHDALKSMANIDGVKVHAQVIVTVDVVAHTGLADSKENTRDKVYMTEMELMDRHPAALFNFTVR